ncbi:hypothetical protein [Prevotella sp.]|uniref:hypothetical protein n=1 Tax=Prevotella sp. TaxID=59823 RepID=UPI003DA1D27B
MKNIFARVYDTLFNVCNKRDLEKWDVAPESDKNIYGVYHVYCDTDWERLVIKQIENLKNSGLFDATTTFYVSCITSKDSDVDKLKEIVGSDKLQIISVTDNPCRYEYPALEYVRQISAAEDCMIYYFHTKGISYQTSDCTDRAFLFFKNKIVAWCEMMEYFIFFKWNVAVNALNSGYDTYGCYLWPPRKQKMYSGSYWWANSLYIRTLPDFREDVIAHDRFYSETWLFENIHKFFSAFDTTADLYFVRISRSLYAKGTTKVADQLRFVFMYNYRKIQKHVFGYNYKKICQKKFQKLKNMKG